MTRSSPDSPSPEDDHAQQWIQVARFPASRDLQPLEQQLDAENILHRVERNGVEQLLLVNHDADAARAVQHCRDFMEAAQGAYRMNDTGGQGGPPIDPRAFVQVSQAMTRRPSRIWLTVATIALGCLGYAFVEITYRQSAFFLALFQNPALIFSEGQVWRLITPTFLHFGWMHILFNALWIWVLGGRIELQMGRINAFSVFLTTALAANVLQYVWSPEAAFGGLSGVVYGYFGYLLIVNRYHPTPVTYIPPGINVMMMVMLVLGLFGVMDIFARGRIANGAHLGGLIAGLVHGFYYVYFQKSSNYQ